jgi:hypothetical protein
MACRYPLPQAVAAIDALARATKLKVADVELLAQRYRGRRGIRAALEALDLVDAGAESPQETRVRLILVRAGFPRPETQIPVYDEYGQLVAVLDMGWREIMVGVDYEGEHHRMSRRSFDRDIRRARRHQNWAGTTSASPPRTPTAASSAGWVGRSPAEREPTANFGLISHHGVTFGETTRRQVSVSSIRVLPRMLGLT